MPLERYQGKVSLPKVFDRQLGAGADAVVTEIQAELEQLSYDRIPIMPPILIDGGMDSKLQNENEFWTVLRQSELTDSSSLIFWKPSRPPSPVFQSRDATETIVCGGSFETFCQMLESEVLPNLAARVSSKPTSLERVADQPAPGIHGSLISSLTSDPTGSVKAIRAGLSDHEAAMILFEMMRIFPEDALAGALVPLVDALVESGPEFFFEAVPPNRHAGTPMENPDADKVIESPGDEGLNRGRIKWFSEKGYGVITPLTPGCDDVFFHSSAIEDAHVGVPEAGHIVEFELGAESPKGPRASIVRLATDV